MCSPAVFLKCLLAREILHGNQCRRWYGVPRSASRQSGWQPGEKTGAPGLQKKGESKSRSILCFSLIFKGIMFPYNSAYSGILNASCRCTVEGQYLF